MVAVWSLSGEARRGTESGMHLWLMKRDRAEKRIGNCNPGSHNLNHIDFPVGDFFIVLPILSDPLFFGLSISSLPP